MTTGWKNKVTKAGAPGSHIFILSMTFALSPSDRFKQPDEGLIFGNFEWILNEVLVWKRLLQGR